MPRLLPVVLLVVIPLTALAAPVPKVMKKRGTPQVEGTTWVSDEAEAKLGVIEYTFQPGGKLLYRYTNGQTYTQGSWRQDGDTLYWECNQKYVEYNTTFKDGQFDGAALNVTGLKWTIALRAKEEK